MSLLQLNDQNGYSIIRINRGKVNAINTPLVKALNQAFADIEKNSSTKGVLLTGNNGFFSAGLDIVELYNYDEKQMNEFFIAFGNLYKQLVQFTKPFISAISGYCPAGGTVIAITSDFRIMADNPKYTIGLNEMQVNVQLAKNIIDGYAWWIGRNNANRLILEGKLLSPQEAHEIALVDEICASNELMAKAESKMQALIKADPIIYANTKKKLRANWIAHLDDNSEQELEEISQIWWNPEVRKKFKSLIEQVSSKNIT